MKLKIESYGATDVGRRRQTNQDCIFFDDGISLYVVADGMGGHSAGEVASRVAVETVSAFILGNRGGEDVSWPYGVDPRYSYVGNSLRSAIMLANQKIWELSSRRADLAGMGTTIVVALAEGDALTVGSAGDSRAYCIRQGAIRQMTTDDSWVQDAVDRGVISQEQARNHLMRNVITRALGVNERIEPRILEENMQPGDYFLFCSDGLHGMLNDSEILATVSPANGNLQKAVRDLISAANLRGGKDNITALIIHVLDQSD